MGNVSTKEQISNAQTSHATEEHTQYPASPLTPTRLAILQEAAADPRSPGSFKRTPVHSPQLSRPSSSYRERVLSRIAQQSSPLDPRSPAALRTPLSKLGAPVTRTPPPLSMSGDPRSPCTNRTPLSLTNPVFVDDDVAVYDGAEFAEEVVMKEDVAQSPQISTPISRSVELVPSQAIIALSSSSPLNSPLMGRKRRTPSRKQAISPLAKSFSAPLPDENSTTQNLKTSTPALTSTPAHPSIANAKPRTPLSPLTHSRAVNSSLNCASIQPIKFRMDPGILG